jgi:aminopeptidase
MLMETPANKLTPAIFCEKASSMLAGIPGVTVTVRDEKWIKDQKMGLFESVSRGSSNQPRFLELIYTPSVESSSLGPLALVGKGVTFDSGGISLKPGSDMHLSLFQSNRNSEGRHGWSCSCL